MSSSDTAGGEEPGVLFTPKQDLLAVLLGMGVTRNAAIKGLYFTGNYNADLAAAWIFENQDSDIDGPLRMDEEAGPGAEDYLDESDFFKMVFVVNPELSMGTGKIAAQVGHATLAIYKMLVGNQQKHGEMLLQWEQFGETKIVLKANSANQLMEFAAKATSLDLANYLVQDAGRTQIAAGSITVLAIMGKCDQVDLVTGDLQLL